MTDGAAMLQSVKTGGFAVSSTIDFFKSRLVLQRELLTAFCSYATSLTTIGLVVFGLHQEGGQHMSRKDSKGRNLHYGEGQRSDGR